MSGTTRRPGAAEMPRPGKEPALTGSFSWLGEEAGGCAVVRSRSSVARAPPNRLGTSRIDQVQRKDRSSPAFCSLRAAALRARVCLIAVQDPAQHGKQTATRRLSGASRTSPGRADQGQDAVRQVSRARSSRQLERRGRRLRCLLIDRHDTECSSMLQGTQPSRNDKLLDQPTWWSISTPTRVTGRRAEQPVG